MATERSLQRVGVEHFDLLMLHNPDTDRLSEPPPLWDGMEEVRRDRA